MATLQLEPELPDISPAQSLDGWRREFCVELLGEGAARIFVRAVESSSFKATELRRAILFVRLDARFSDLAACVDAIRPDLSSLADTARRSRPDKDNLFATVEYDRNAWERVQRDVDRWARR
jgi:hypothetical protein